MKAMVLEGVRDMAREPAPLVLRELKTPRPGQGRVLLKVEACGVCHTELDEIEGRTPPSAWPMVLGHQVVGRVVERGPGARRHALDQRLGVGWFFASCGVCVHCGQGRENLCAEFRATGRDAPGGYAEYMAVGEDSAFPIPEVFSPAQAAPLLCAGAVGLRALRLSGLANGQRLGLTGFGASGHLVLKLVRAHWPDTPVHVFARAAAERAFARELGAVWAGAIDERPPEPLDAIIDTTPAWRPVVEALASLAPGGRLVINAIRKENGDKPSLLDLDYPAHLWLEKEVKSVANVTRRDIEDFLGLAAAVPILPEYEPYPLAEANQALAGLKAGRIRGAKVLVMD